MTEAWHGGDHAAVIAVLDAWDSANAAKAERLRNDPEFMARIEAIRSEIAAQEPGWPPRKSRAAIGERPA